MNRLKVMAGILAVTWVTLASMMLWHNFSVDYRDFLHEGAPDLTNTPVFANGKVTMVHYLDERCSCNRFAEPHVRDLQDDYPDLEHVRVYPDRVMDSAQQSLAQWAISTPSLSIYRENGQLLYHGPYTSGAICGEGQDLVKTELQRNQQGDALTYINVLGFGCFCPWKTKNQRSVTLSPL